MYVHAFPDHKQGVIIYMFTNESNFEAHALPILCKHF